MQAMCSTRMVAVVSVLLYLAVLATPTASAAMADAVATEPRGIDDLLQAVNQVQCMCQLATVSSMMHVTRATRHCA